MTDPAPGLAERQAALVRALVAGEPVPCGFDPDAVRTAADAILRKRARETAAHYPALAQATGPEFTALYIAWARGRPKGGTAADALGFARDHEVPWPPQPPPAANRLSGLLRLRRPR
ncbi:hypothetical protein [Nocardia sp. CA-290969]|uniref:hypothetical protein n=1 Tax=Nocardia sp. CA-290969 TaxID=3239986 RepID=UPI003D8E3294